MKYINRQITDEILSIASKFPVVTIIGPRQSGKTTLVRYVFDKKEYVSLENPDIRELAENDPRLFLNKFPKGAILDEIQRVPSLLSYIQGIVDDVQINGMWILTGSNQILLHDKINQSLAGRTSILRLLPFDFEEQNATGINMGVNDYLYNGFYPRIYANKLNPFKAYSDYYATYIERDVRQIVNVKDISMFQKFMMLCAGRVGSVFNANQLANEVGVSVPTINSWLSVLEASFIVYMLPPWFDNISKRLVKSPKLYFYDVGLASFLLGIRKKQHLETHPMRGHLFENLLVTEVLKMFYNSGYQPNIYYYRDNHGNEVDLVIPDGHQLIPVEIKSSETFHYGFLKGLNYFKKLYPKRVEKSFVVYAGDWEQEVESSNIVKYTNFTEQLDLF